MVAGFYQQPGGAQRLPGDTVNVLMLLIPLTVCGLVYFLLRALMVAADHEDEPYEHEPLADDTSLTYDRRQVHLDRDHP